MELRGVAFIALLLLILLLEWAVPRRRPRASLRSRLCNLGLSFMNGAGAFLLPFSAGAAALYARERQAGLLYVSEGPWWLEGAAAVIALDLIVYLQHLMFHGVPLLWRLHKVHHADEELNVTTALRFHPGEIFLSVGIKAGAVLALGAPVGAVLLFEVLLNGCAMFNHGNFYLPRGADRALRLLVVTPDMHRVHHSVLIRETDSNFGFCLTWWDHLFGTYRGEALRGQRTMKLGLSCYRKGEARRFFASLLMPFDSRGEVYSFRGIGRMPQGGESSFSGEREPRMRARPRR